MTKISKIWIMAISIVLCALAEVCTLQVLLFTFYYQILECENAIKQRDEVISQLSENLRQTTENRDSLQADYQRQAEQLAEQVQVLQDQLKQVRQLQVIQDQLK